MDPTKIRLSEHFLLSDFLGNHSVYTRGLPNMPKSLSKLQHDNAVALCAHALEPLLQQYGPFSISYGFITPETSRVVVTYQDPDKPSHHRWDLGAAADVCVHEWVNSDPDDDTVATAPIMLAHEIDRSIPYSRLITYSESPYLCIAVKASEVESQQPRKAFYENRYAGVRGAKPEYRSMSTSTARYKGYEAVRPGLRHGWRGVGYPTYHGGGRRQYQHVRISKYTMLSDWLFDLQSIACGAKNMPSLRDPVVWDTFCAVGDAYDEIVDLAECGRLSIVRGYVSPANPFFDPDNDWRTGTATFSLVPPASMTAEDIRMKLLFGKKSNIIGFGRRPDILDITVRL